MEKISFFSKKKLISFFNDLSSILRPGDVVFLYGDLGVGKTFSTGVMINYHVNDIIVPSPTFNILHEYKVKDLKILHYDLYRVKDENELENLGQILDQENALTFVEWPDLLKNNTSNLISLIFKYEDNLNKRSLIISSENNKINDEFK